MNYSHEAKVQLFEFFLTEPSLPYVKVRRDTLGGEARATFLVTVSLDDSKDWPHGIFENSRYAKFLLADDKIELLSGGPGSRSALKFRKQRATSNAEAFSKIRAFTRAWASTSAA